MQPSQAAVFSGRCDLVVPSSLCKEAAISRSWHLLCVCVTAVRAKPFHQQTDRCFSQGVGFGGAIRDVPILGSNPRAVTESSFLQSSEDLCTALGRSRAAGVRDTGLHLHCWVTLQQDFCCMHRGASARQCAGCRSISCIAGCHPSLQWPSPTSWSCKLNVSIWMS